MARTKKSTEPVCVWTLDRDNWGDSWDTACGEKYVFIDGGPRENGQRFCGYCGRFLKERQERAA